MKEKVMKHRLSYLIVARLVLLLTASAMTSFATADEIHVASSGGFAAAYRALAGDFEARTGHTLVTVWGPSMGETSGALPKRLERGEPIDVVIMAGDALDKLIKQGRVEDAGHRLLANSKIGAAVRAGAAKPDVSTIEGLKQALLQARSIAYSDSASGEYLSKTLFPRLGLEAQIKGKSRMIPAEPVAQVVARGDADLGFQQVSELLPVAGIEFVGELPEEAQQVTPFSGGIVAGTKVHSAAKALLEYLSSAESAPLIRKTGLTPPAPAVN
jgi:molybdate transport system substrate-binding protein